MVVDGDSSPGEGTRIWHFADVSLDERTLELRVAGQPARVERKPLEVLRYLLAHAGEVMTRDELEAAVWPARVLSDTVLKKAVSRLRDVLRDDREDIIKTVRGYGYRLVAETRIERVRRPASPRFDFKAGEAPPLRPGWRFVEKLDAGGHGEAWLIEHGKLRDRRVLKFAFDDKALVALKREITLSRLLHQALGDDDFVRILDWNLAEPPYFTESGYAESGNLEHWADARGGLKSLPLAERIALAAQVADKLARAHGVGVLHKDLKPSNIFVSAHDGATRLQLADFGSGALLDDGKLDVLGITRLGFTGEIADMQASGTLMYLPPEVVAGQPATVRADVYALGVLLYQLVVGDFHRPLVAGWEQGIDDELLREDIAAAAHGDANRRLGDAATLARRLRALPERRAQREAERAARVKAEADARALEKLRARRAGYLVAIGVLLLGLASTLYLYFTRQQALQRADIAADTARQETDFVLSLFNAVAPQANGGKSIEPRELIDAGRRQLENRFKDKPLLHARLLHHVGDLYCELGLPDECRQAVTQAIAEYRRQPDVDPANVGMAMAILAVTYTASGEFGKEEQVAREALAMLDKAHADDEANAGVKARLLQELGGALSAQDRTGEAVRMLERARRLLQDKDGRDTAGSMDVLPELASAYRNDEQNDKALRTARDMLALAGKLYPGRDNQYWFDAEHGYALLMGESGHPLEAIPAYRDAIAGYARIYGADNIFTADAEYNLGNVLQDVRPSEAAVFTRRALEAHGQRGTHDYNYQTALGQLTRIAMARGDYAAAQQLQARRDPPAPGRIPRYDAARLAIGLGRIDEALEVLKNEVPADLHSGYANYMRAQRLRWLADAHIAAGRFAEADAECDAMRVALDRMRDDDRAPLAVDVRCARALLGERRFAQARAMLARDIPMLVRLDGDDALFPAMARIELAQAEAALGNAAEARRLAALARPVLERELAPPHWARRLLARL